MDSLEAIMKAINHYNSETKEGKQYAVSILCGLYKAYRELSKYKDLKDKYFNE